MPKRPYKTPRTTITPKNMMRLALSDEQKERLHKLAADDRRKLADFVRILIDEEWERRQKALQGNGAAA